MQATLPLEAYEGLFLVAAGDSVNQVLMDRETRVDRTIDTTDFATALATPESQSRYVVVNDDQTMLASVPSHQSTWGPGISLADLRKKNGDLQGSPLPG